MPTCTCASPIGSRNSPAIVPRSTQRSSAGTSSRHTAISPNSERSTRSRKSLARRAADRLAAAGWTASARGDVSAGVSLRSRALALMPTGAPNRPQVLADLGEALLWRGRFQEADRALTEAIELAEGAGDERMRVRARLSQPRLRFQVDPAADYEHLEAEALTRRRSARRAATTSGRLAPGGSSTGLAGVSVSWNVCARPRSALSSTTGAHATRTTRSWTWSECSSRWYGDRSGFPGASAGAGDSRADAGAPWRGGFRHVLPRPGSRECSAKRRRLAR